MKPFLSIIALASLALATGCEQKAAFLTLNADGSGTLLVRYSYDESAGENPASPPEPSTPEELAEEVKETVTKMAARMGEITFVSGKPITNKKGWPGYEGTYSFKDINKVRVSFAASEDTASVSGMEMPLAPTYSFNYTPGVKLEITAKKIEADKKFDAAKIDIAKWTMLKGVFNGARETVLVKLDSPVQDSNAKFIVGKNKDTLLLFDFLFEKIADPSAMAKIEALRAGKGPGESLQLPGVRMQNPMEKVTVSF